jgi:uncharacterized protein
MWFTNVIKPTHKCNLSCAYCYNEDMRKHVMDAGTLRRVIEETFSYAACLPGHPPVDFIWHGGEPMLAGIEFFREVVAIQQTACNGTGYANSIQTNGTLLNDKWAAFFRKEHFDVSLSIDGPRDVHDRARRYADGKGSFNKVMKGIAILRKHRIPHGVCVVLSQSNAADVDRIFSFLARETLPFNVIPLTLSGRARTSYTDMGLGPKEYAAPWIRMFDLWFDAAEEYYVQCTDFVRKARAILTGRPADCIGEEQCGSTHISTDPYGYIYPCATLSGDAGWRYGNIQDRTLAELMRDDIAAEAGSRNADVKCGKCKWRHVCHGGCMSRAIKFYGDHHRRDYYCPSLYKMYEHIESRLKNVPGLDVSKLPAVSASTECRHAKRARDQKATGYMLTGNNDSGSQEVRN